MRLFFVGNLQKSGAALGHRLSTGCLGVEVVLTGLARENLAVFSDFEAFRIRFSGFH